MYCQKCGGKISSSAGCVWCANDRRDTTYVHTDTVAELIQKRNRYVATLLAFFLGWVGIHKFYLGRIGQGIVYVLFCWTFIPFLLGLIEGAIYLSMSDQSFNTKYNKES